MSEATDTTNTTQAPDQFASLAAHAATLEANSLPPNPDAPAPVDHRAEAREVTEFACSIVLPMLPARYADRYGTRQQAAIGNALGAWCEARGVSMGDLLGRWAPELALLAALVGPVLPVLVADARARAERAARPAPQPEPTP